MTSTTNNPPPQFTADYELKGKSIEEILEEHLAWAWGKREDKKSSLSMRSGAIENNAKLRIELRKIEKGQAGESAGMDALYKLLQGDNEDQAARSDDGQGGDDSPPADRRDPEPA